MSKIVYKYHKQIDNTLHKAAFRGQVSKINSLLTDCSPYKTTSGSETPLHLSLATGHQNAAHIFLKILETDVTAAKRYLKKRNIELDNENFAFALGKRQIEMVNESCGEMVVQVDEGCDSSTLHQCSLVLMKESIYTAPDVWVLRPNNQKQKFVLLSTIFQLMKENGVISFNVQRSTDNSTLLHLAAARGYTAVVMKLLDLGANPYLKDNAHLTAMGAAHSMGEFPTYVEMCRRLNLNMFATKNFVRLPINNAVWENVEFLIETLVTLRMEKFEETRGAAMKTVLSMNDVAGTFLLSNVGEKCLETYGEYLPEKQVAKIIMLLVNDRNNVHSTPVITKRLLQDSSLVKAKTSRVIQYRTHNTVLHTLIRNGRSDIVSRIYQECPELKTLLFQHKELGLSALIQCIQSDHVELAQFLIAEHENEIDRPQLWSQLLIAAAELPGSMDFMKLILQHPKTDPNLVLHGAQSIQTNALFTCIVKGNLAKVKVLLESSKMTDLNIIQSNYETLLKAAICSMNSPTTVACSGNYSDHNRHDNQFKYLTNDAATSEDENEPNIPQPQETNNETSANKYATMNKIFDLLVEKGANFKHIDKSHQTLLHHAVAQSNKYVVERLLNLGLDPIDPDRNGNVPLHFVSNIEIFNILQAHRTFQQTITERNKLGAGVLHHFVRGANASIDLCSMLIDVIDVNVLDNSGNTPLHYLATTRANFLCEFFIENRADVNLKNSNGLTATHIALSHENFGMAALLIKQPTFDVFTLTDSGKSYLTLLTRITDYNFEEVKIALDTRIDDLNRLIELYCNELDDDGLSNLFHSINNKYLLQLLITQPHIEVNVDASRHADFLLHKVGDNVQFTKFLIEKGFDVNQVDGFNRTPLTQALTDSHGVNLDVVRCLIEAGANINFVASHDGNSPLHEACVHFDLETIKILLEAGADCNVKNCHGKTPFDHLPIEYRSIITNILV